MTRMSKEIITRLGRLLYMRYRPSELAAEIGCHVDTVYRSFVPSGCPHRRDEQGHIWIIGTEFAEWARAIAKRKHAPLGEGEVFCLKCRARTRMTGHLIVKPTNHYLELVAGECSECGTTVHRARARHNDNGERADS